MGNIKKVLAGIKKCGVSFIKYNYLCPNIKRKNGAYFYPNKGSIIQLASTANIELCGDLEINAGKYKGSHTEAYFIVDKNARVTVGGKTRISYGSTIHVNENALLEIGSVTTNVGINFQIKQQLSFGNDCMVGRNTTIFDSSFHPIGNAQENIKVSTVPICIGNHVWIGANAFVASGTKIGDGSIIGSHAYVSGNIPAACTIIGSVDTNAIYGNIWARSEAVQDVSKAMNYYKKKENVLHLSNVYVSQLEALISNTYPGLELRDRDDLVSSHTIDSLKLLSIVHLISNAFSIKIPFYEINAKNFDSLLAMSSMISRIKEEKNSAEQAEIRDIKAYVQQDEIKDFVLEDFNSILEAILHYAQLTPSKLCISDGQQDFTYEEFINLVKRLAAYFIHNGVKRDDKVVVEAIQSPFFVAVEMALHAIGAVFVPMEKNCAHEKLVKIANICGGKQIISVAPIDGYKGLTYDMLRQCDCNLLEDIELPDPNGISEILFSTGTTGKEKGVVLTHKSSVAVAENILYGTAMRNSNIELIPSPLNHSHGLRSYYANMIVGGTVIAIDGVMDVDFFFRTIEKYNVNSIDLVPTALSIILKLSDDQFGKYKNQLRFMEFGSAPMLDEDRCKIISLLPDVPLYNFYGSTEAGRATVYNFNSPVFKNKCIGKPTHNSNIMIVDDDKNVIKSSKDNVGLIACSGSMCMVEYFEDEAETKTVFVDGVVYTNDEAYFDEDGDIILLGRRGDVINIGGKKVSPEEIESVAKLIPGVEDCGCISIADSIAGNVPKLFVQMKSEVEFDSKKIHDFLAFKLEPYKVPTQIVSIEKIPRTYNGKLSRKELKNK